jgi:adenylate cyclase
MKAPRHEACECTKASGKSSIAAAHRVYSYSAFPLPGHVVNPSRDAGTEEALEQTIDFNEKDSVPRLLESSEMERIELRDLVPAFAPVLEVTAGRRIYAELLATYVGQDPCARIMAGAVQRGNVHHIKAAMLLADLRGFSRLTDELSEERIIELLNAFFDLVVPGIIGSGGDVLKYIGDAVIAIFPVTRDDPAQACESALAAAQTTLAALQALPPELQQHIFIDIALHYGDAAYGNIGSGNRLDFTAVGRDINILSRLELLCKDVGRPLLMSGAFAAEVAAPVFEIGHFELRGFRQHQSLYGLRQD